MKQAQVLIVGAGPTGLVLALSLAKMGIRLRIIDKKTGIGRESRALGVQARTLEFYRQLGIADDVVASGVQVERIFVQAEGNIAAEFDVHCLGKGISPYPFILCLPQDEHEAILVRHLKAAGVEVEWQTELSEMNDIGIRVQATLLRNGSQLIHCDADYLCACDGGRSLIRSQLNIGFEGSTSENSYFVADVKRGSDAKSQGTSSRASTFCLTGADFMLVLPARRSGTHRLIGLLPAALQGRSNVNFEEVNLYMERTAHIKIETLNWFSTYRVHHRVADRFRVGRIFIAGDAGHIHSPLGGQGMNTGIGDAFNLAWKLAAVLQERANASLLDTYEIERIAFARFLVSTTDRLFQFVNGSSWRKRFVRKILFLFLIPRLLSYGRTRKLVFRRISQTQLNYRTSSLSVSESDGVKGGDRLPWLSFPDGSDNFAPLNTLDWQVHVYGQAGQQLHALCQESGLTLHEFRWNPDMHLVQLQRNSHYLIRPDGYVALAEADGDARGLRAHLIKFEVTGFSGRLASEPNSSIVEHV